MKRQYSVPLLTVHGNVKQLTKAIGPTPTSDSIIFNGEPLGVPTDGSGDITLP